MATKIDAAVEKLKAQLKQAELRQKQLRTQEHLEARRKARAQETRRKILLGALVEKAFLEHPSLKAYLLQSAYTKGVLIRDSDRELLGLPPIPKKINT